MKKNKGKSSGGRLRKILLSPGMTAAMFVVAAGLLLISGIGGARAALTYISEYYSSEVGMYHIGVTLLENNQDNDHETDQDIAYRNYSGEADGSWETGSGYLLDNMLADKTDANGNVLTDTDGNPIKEDVKIGTAYTEKLAVRNSSGENESENPGINQFVRVSLYKYWLDKSPKDPTAVKLPDLDPEAINLHLINVDDNGPWILDRKASTSERTVLYYSKLLPAAEGSNVTEYLSDTLTIDQMVAKKVTQSVTTTNNGKTITTVYDYDGKCFAIEATVDAVQQHNAKEAIQSAWGREVSISGSGDDLTLSLVDNN